MSWSLKAGLIAPMPGGPGPFDPMWRDDNGVRLVLFPGAMGSLPRPGLASRVDGGCGWGANTGGSLTRRAMVKRALRGGLIAAAAVLAAGAAWADCTADVAAARQQYAAVKDDSQRRELSLLLDKAEADAKAGRESQCRDALVRAQALVH